MASAQMVLPRPIVNFGELLKNVALPTEREQTKKTLEAGEVIREIVTVIDGLVLTTVEQRTLEDFERTRKEVFQQYVVAIRALGDIARIVLPKPTLERLSLESFSHMEADFRDLGNAAFGSDLTSRGIFTVWTLRKIHDLAVEISASPRPDNTKEDAEKAMDFIRAALWNRFHVDCLIKAMRTGRPIYPEVVEPIRDGLRAAVNAYAAIRLWADLRNPRTEPEFGAIEWTADDELLLNDSMQDLDRESA